MECYIGEIRAFSGKRPPRGWHFCDGTLLTIAGNDALYSLLGIRYGGDGVTNFGLPDLRSRIPLGMSTRTPAGTKGGLEKVELSVGNLPKHRHAPRCSTVNVADIVDATGGFWSAVTVKGRRFGLTPGSIRMHEESIEPTGSNEAHENRMPVIAISYIISLEGVYPDQL